MLPVADRHVEYARRGPGRSWASFRVEVDERTESIGRKIREAELRKIPYMLVVGDREVEYATRAGAPAPRGRSGRAVARRGAREAAARVEGRPVGIRAPRVTLGTLASVPGRVVLGAE